ncbi:hypothetical protein SIAM614_00367 [Stappia aggregata IAM 12614]|uniref:Uncharacterized protein n=1 Tax=Roseibium aggregatum (strain ATCC 25650 / DSM 13394 / JCM 20685 / NBRC 16684 / NCIMB 2208 / IAM 12614 / B1) TaxID=384765 RepID=A0P2J6_ROSAI|nr:hypothetical protein SIAM614_00367 [Stappia aggregata IAM 12614] [Roseibium aggregatum IAM 12614]
MPTTITISLRLITAKWVLRGLLLRVTEMSASTPRLLKMRLLELTARLMNNNSE